MTATYFRTKMRRFRLCCLVKKDGSVWQDFLSSKISTFFGKQVQNTIFSQYNRTIQSIQYNSTINCGNDMRFKKFYFLKHPVYYGMALFT